MGKAVRGAVAAVATLITLAALVPPLAGASGRAPRAVSGSARATTRARPGGLMWRRPVTSAVDAARPSSTQVRPSGRGTDRATWPAAAPSDTFGFDAISRIGPNWPADPTGAVSETWFLTAVNTHMALYDRTGTVVIQPRSLENLFDLPAGTQVFDPKVVYDQYGQTFVLTFLAVDDARSRSWILLVAIPNATADQDSTWCGTQIGADRTRGDGRQWPDYPALGYSGDRVTVSTNQFGFQGGRFASVQILSFPKGSLYDCSGQVDFDTFAGDSTRNPDGSRGFTIVPAVSVGADAADTLLLSFEPGRPASLVLWRIDVRSGGPVLQSVALPVGRTRAPPWGTQCQGSLNRSDTWWDAGDIRIVSAFYDADLGRVYAAHAVGKDLTPDPQTGTYVESVVRWYEVQPRSRLGSSTLTRSGTIGAPETDAGWPAVATDTSGNLIVTYSRASQPGDECLSAWAAMVAPGSRSAESTMLAEGQARFEALRGPERWGDYNAASRDPVDGSLIALVNQYALDDGGPPTTVDWQQTVHVVSGA